MIEIFQNILFIFLGILGLGISIFVHELGHFLAAKKRGLIADRFSIGFGPRLFGWKYKGTDFRISLIPLGGYVSLPQLSDMGRLEGGDKLKNNLPEIGYADKMIVAVMGAVFNILFAFLISLIIWGTGRELIQSTSVGLVGEYVINSAGEKVAGPAYFSGVQSEDIILKVDGNQVNNWEEIQLEIVTGVDRSADNKPKSTLTIQRGNEILTIITYPEIVSSEHIRSIGIMPETDSTSSLIVTALEKGMPAIEAGLKINDRVISLNGEPIISSAFLKSFLSKNYDREISVEVERNGERNFLLIKPKIKTEAGETNPRFGFAYGYDYKRVKVHQNPISQIISFAEMMKKTLKALINKNSDLGLKNMSGPVGIVHGLKIMAGVGWIDFIWFVALINVNLALFNLLPIPVLDGGHMLFATLSKLSRKPIPLILIEKIQSAFLILLLFFIVYVTFFDLRRINLIPSENKSGKYIENDIKLINESEKNK